MEAERKMNLLSYVRGDYLLVREDDYSSLKDAPSVPKRPEWVYLGEILGVDFDKDIYHHPRVSEISRQMKLSQKYGCWHLGDCFTDLVYKHIVELPLTESNILALDIKVTELYEEFKHSLRKRDKLAEMVDDIIAGKRFNEYISEREITDKILESIQLGYYIKG